MDTAHLTHHIKIHNLQGQRVRNALQFVTGGKVLQMSVGIKQKDIKRITLGYFLKLGASLGTEQFVQFRPILVDRVFFLQLFLDAGYAFLTFYMVLYRHLYLGQTSGFHFFGSSAGSQCFNQRLLVFRGIRFQRSLLMLLPFLPSLRKDRLKSGFLLFQCAQRLFLSQYPAFVFGKQLFQLGIRFLLKREPLVYFQFVLLQDSSQTD